MAPVLACVVCVCVYMYVCIGFTKRKVKDPLICTTLNSLAWTCDVALR